MCLTTLVNDLKEKSLIDKKTAIKLNENFSGLNLEMIQNQLSNRRSEGEAIQKRSEEVRPHLTFLLSPCL